MTALPPDLPAALAAQLVGHRASVQTIGKSAAGVFRLESADRPMLFLKTEPTGPFCEIEAEEARLLWLADAGVPAPEVVAFESDARTAFLLMTAIPGIDLATVSDLAAHVIVDIVAHALSTLHALSAETWPFDRRLDRVIEDAGRRVAAGIVDESDFDPSRLGRSALDLHAELLARRPPAEDVVVCHGDACLPNLLAYGERFSGFVDCSRLGLADRHADLALAARSLAFNLGADWSARLFDAYGMSPDPERLAYYRLVDEFF